MPSKPEGIILVRSGAGQGGPNNLGILFGIWPSGLIRRITSVEYAVWGSPQVDKTLVAGVDDREWDYLFSYDLALRVPKSQWNL